MPLTEDQIEIIAENPLGDGLESIRTQLRNCTDVLSSGMVTKLLEALLTPSAALDLPSPRGNGDVADELLALRRKVRKGVVELKQFRPLIQRVVDESPDADVWEAVLFIINNNLGALTPPRLCPSFIGTPVETSSKRFPSIETHDMVEAELFGELKDCTFRDVGGFWDKFFDPSSWREEQNTMLTDMLTAHDGERWTDFPRVPDARPVWDWLSSLDERFLDGAPFRFHTTSTADDFRRQKGQMDLFLRKRTARASNAFLYKHVLVAGQQKKSYATGRFKADLLQLAYHARTIFADQPTRRLVHAFTLCAARMELWVFDRSGAYSSGEFDIHEEPDKLARALVGYTTMRADTMGLDTFVEWRNGHRYVTVDTPSGSELRVRLDRALVRREAIVSRGTTCYATQGGHVVKFAWTPDKRRLEAEQLRIAEAMGVKGLARLVAHRWITTTAEMREGLQILMPHPFRSEPARFDDDLAQAASDTHAARKRNVSSSRASDGSSGRERWQSDRKKLKLVTASDDPLPSSKTQSSLYAPGNDLWQNKIYSCLVISPAGRVISDFCAIKELLEAQRDAIRAHQSLLVDGGILHRDISVDNIIITRPETADGFKGMLIDLDLARETADGPSGARHRAGTMTFMAVEVLRRTDHTYRHDLESFLYVLLWTCACDAWRNGFEGEQQRPRESRLHKWETGSFEDMADAKEGHMTVHGLERIMGEFPASLDIVKSLCLRIRTILFPQDEDGRMSFGTPAGDPDQLYRPIIAAYDKAIRNLK